MAVDTADKRRSMMSFGDFGSDLLPSPEGTLEEEDRWSLLELYNGFLDPSGGGDGGGGAGGSQSFIIFHRRRSRR